MLKPLLTTTDPANYAAYFNEKITAVTRLFKEAALSLPEPELCRSPPEYYRMRAEFAVFSESDGSVNFAMFRPGTAPRERIIINHFPIACREINQALDLLRDFLRDESVLRRGLFAAGFLANQRGELIITLCYHRRLDEERWRGAARALKARFGAAGLKTDFTAHARGQTVLADTDTLLETLRVRDREFYLYQVEGSFTQPNLSVCRRMAAFARDCCQDCLQTDLIELYCGSGTFTVCLADLFRRVLATEISRIPVRTALKNLEKNGITNTAVVRLSALEAAQALDNVRQFRRLKSAGVELGDFDFRTLLIDPPRDGLGTREAREFAARFERVLYVSCGPDSMAEDLKWLCRTHEILRVGFFDQFPYTRHLETIALLRRRG